MRSKSCSPSVYNGPCGQDLPKGRLRRKFPKTLPSRGPWLASGLCCPAGSSLTMTSSAPLSSTRQLMDSLSSHPARLGGRREGPQFTRRVCSCVPSPEPRWTGRLQLAVASPTALAFALFAEARHPQCHASWFARGLCNEADRFTFATARTVASPSPTRTFTIELSSTGSPHSDVDYDYTGKQPIPAAGLSPARHSAIWAANKATQELHLKGSIPVIPVKRRFRQSERQVGYSWTPAESEIIIAFIIPPSFRHWP